MKVCVINPDLYRSSGVTVGIKRIHSTVLNYGVDNYFVICNDDFTKQDISWIPEGRLKIFNLMSLNPLILIKEIIRFSAWIDDSCFDVLHVHHRRLSLLLSLINYKKNIKVFYSANLTYGFNFLFWLLSPINVIAVTMSVFKNVRSTTRSNNVKIIGNPTYFPCCVDSDVSINMNQAVCVARLDSVKGHRNLIDAWSLLVKNGFLYRLIIVGEGDLEKDLRAQVNSLGLPEYIEFIGYSDNVLPFYLKSLFAILVSKVEGQGIVTIEAAAAGRASLLTDVDGSRDCLPDNRSLPNGIKYGDVESLAEAIKYWFDHPDEVLLEGRKFFEFHKKINSFEAIGRKYFNAYKNL